MGAKGLLLKDYMDFYTKKILKIRKKIQRTNSRLSKIILTRRYKKLLFKMQAFLPTSKDISSNIIFPHGLSGVFISNGAKIGDGCVVFQQVTIGSNALEDSKMKGSPVIGKNCYIGVGAKIIGAVKVGDNVRIGANTVVAKDVPDNATVVGAKTRIIEHEFSRDNSFVAFGNKKGNSK